MQYIKLCEIYEELEKTSSRIKKTEIIAKFLTKLKTEKDKEVIYLLQGKVFPDYSEKEFGISEQLCIKALAKASGISKDKLIKDWKKIGDLGLVALKTMESKKQGTLFSKKLTMEKVEDNLQKLPELIGKGTIDRKLGLISELLTSASGLEAKYIIRTLLSQLRIGVGPGTVRESIVLTCFKDKNKKIADKAVEDAYDRISDFAKVFEKACIGIKELQKITITPDHPLRAMLALKAKDVSDGFKKVGKPAALEYKYDGFRMMMNKDAKGNIKIFTRHLDCVTNQFPEVVKYLKEHIKAKSYILDGEAVGYDSKTKKFKPFQAISQRIKRKHNIAKLVKELPVELNVFDILYLNGKSLLETPFIERTKIMRKLVKNKKYHFQTAIQIITSDEKEAQEFYKQALKDDQEGIMFKNLNFEYKPGSRVGHMLKLKPAENELDLVITSAEYGKGKRAGALSSFTLSCINDKGEYVEIGKAAGGLKEKTNQGLSFTELTNMLKPLITKEKNRTVYVKPKIVVTILYQNIQRSPTYKSGFALRFPRIVQLRPDRDAKSVATVKEITEDYKRHELKIHY